MASLDGLSNRELREKLVQYGYQAGPVTDSTRKVFLKKLQQLMVNSEKPNSEPVNKSRRTLSRYSSGEDTENEDSKVPKTSMPPPSVNYKSLRKASVKNHDASISSANKRRSEISLRNDLFTNSHDSVTDETKHRKQLTGRYSVNVLDSPDYSPQQDNRSRRTRKSYASKQLVVQDDTGSDSDVSDRNNQITDLKGKKSGNVSVNNDTRSSVSSSFLPTFSSVRSRFLSSDSHNSSFADSNNSSVNEKPYFQSDFMRRLSSLSPKGDNNVSSSNYSPMSCVDDVKESDVSDEDEGPPNGHYFATHRSHKDLSQEFKTTEDEVKFWKNSQIISMILVTVAIVFFSILAVMYMNVRSKEIVGFTLEHKDNVFPLCNDSQNQKLCVANYNQIKSATSLISHLYPELVRRTIANVCGPENPDGTWPSPVMTSKTAYFFLLDVAQKDVSKLEIDIHNLKILLIHNKHWGLSLVDIKDEEIQQEAIVDISEDKKEYLVNVGGFVASDVYIPLSCQIWLKLIKTFQAVCILAAGFIIFYLGHISVSWYLNYRETRKRQIYSLVEKIIEVLMAHHYETSSTGKDTCLAINHVRDQLIPPQNRKALSGLWDSAVEFLERNESRVRCEVQQIAGEECPVWRWLPPTFNNTSRKSSSSPSLYPSLSNLNKSQSPRNRIWQGQAFETMAGSPNCLPCTPTPCLKIRHMFDCDEEEGEEWPLRIQDAILEKCDGVKVLHIAVDKFSKEGCVYMKCMSKEDAGKAFHSLHGWWFDSKLVTVKFLKLERYHEHFPETIHARIPLQPSNNKKLSVQPHFWKSPLEAN